jgi:hypothetical protein
MTLTYDHYNTLCSETTNYNTQQYHGTLVWHNRNDKIPLR